VDDINLTDCVFSTELHARTVNTWKKAKKYITCIHESIIHFTYMLHTTLPEQKTRKCFLSQKKFFENEIMLFVMSCNNTVTKQSWSMKWAPQDSEVTL